MDFRCKLFGHSLGKPLDYIHTPSQHRHSSITGGCVIVRTCRICGYEDVQKFPKHEFRLEGNIRTWSCKEIRHCERCGYVGSVAPHKIKDCHCTVCGQEFHEWDGCHCKRCTVSRHNWSGCVCTSCRKSTHVRDGEQCCCRKCGEPMHELKGCRCVRCGAVQHEAYGCRCVRCGETHHDFNMSGISHGHYVCRRCGSYMHPESGNITEL
jgi:hypothetical protein